MLRLFTVIVTFYLLLFYCFSFFIETESDYVRCVEYLIIHSAFFLSLPGHFSGDGAIPLLL